MATALLSAGVITDATRLAALDGDGRPSSDSSVGLFPETEQWVQNGGAEVNTARWTVSNGLIKQGVSDPVFGDHDFVVTASAANMVMSGGRVIGSPLAQGYWYAAAWLTATPETVGKNMRIRIDQQGGETANAMMAFSDITIPAGRSRLFVTGQVTAADRTTILIRLESSLAAAGDIFLLDGIRCGPGHEDFPYVANDEPVTIWTPVVNLFSNPSFEAGLSGWSGVGATATQSPDVAHDGTKSAKLVAGSSGDHYLTGGGVTGSPISQVTHAFRGWFYATADVVGKLAAVSLNETGGTSGQAQFAGGGGPLVAGWNYFLGYGTPAQSDRTGITAFCRVYGQDTGDTWYVDDLAIGAGYVELDPVIATRAAARVQLPTDGWSARQGSIALSVAFDWDSTSALRPDLPCVLMQWVADADNGLWLTYNGGAFILTRTALGVSESVAYPLAFARDDIVTVIAAWTADGIGLSVNGGAFIGPLDPTPLVFDDFNRADTSTGTLGAAATGQAWAVSGAGSCRIQSNQYVPGTSDGNGYAGMDAGESPVRFGGAVAWSGSGVTENVTLISSATDSAFQIQRAVHLYCDHDSASVQFFTVDGFVNLISWGLVALAFDGTPHEWRATVNDNTVYLELPDGQRRSVSNDLIRQLYGRYLIFEVGRAGTLISQWDEARVERRLPAFTGGGYVPDLTGATYADIGSAGDGTGHINGRVNWVKVRNGRTGGAWPAETSAIAPYRRRMDDARVSARRLQ